MRRFALQLGIAIAVVIATAVMDLGPRASAAYVSMADVSAGCGTGTSTVHESDTPSPTLLDLKSPVAAHFQGGSGMTPPSTGPSGGSVPLAGYLTQTEIPVDGLVVFFREPAASIHLTAFIDCLLDPPRQA